MPDRLTIDAIDTDLVPGARNPIRENVTIDWTEREAVRAELRSFS